LFLYFVCNKTVITPVCLYVYPRISLEPLDRSSPNLVNRSPLAVARSSFGDVAICHVLPVLWITSRLAVVAMRGGVAIPRRSLMSMSALC